MRPFEYTAAASVEAAVAAAARRPGEAAYIAGGSNLVDMMTIGVAAPSLLIDINALPLGGVEVRDGGLRIGALARNSDVAAHAGVRELFPMLSEALLAGASPQLRNMATVGGNLVQRTRCPYFRDTASACNRREPGSGCAATGGVHRGHAVLGTSESCIATHPSDMCVPLAALDGTVQVTGPRGARRVPLRDLHPLPGQHPERETALEPGDLIVAVDVPPLPWAGTSRYVKVRDRASYAFALASAAVALDVEDGTIRDARVALGGVATTPWHAPAAEAALRGRPATEAAFREAADAAVDGARPLRDNAFKIDLVRRVLVRALTSVSAAARGGILR